MKVERKEQEHFFETKKIDYEFIEHDVKIHSAKAGAEYFNINLGQTAATLILSVDGKLYAVIVSGKRNKLDFAKIGELLKAKEVKLASKEKIFDALEMVVGCIPMFNLPIPCIIDEVLLNYDYVYGGTGVENRTLKLRSYHLMELNENHMISGEI